MIYISCVFQQRLIAYITLSQCNALSGCGQLHIYWVVSLLIRGRFYCLKYLFGLLSLTFGFTHVNLLGSRQYLSCFRWADCHYFG